MAAGSSLEEQCERQTDRYPLLMEQPVNDNADEHVIDVVRGSASSTSVVHGNGHNEDRSSTTTNAFTSQSSTSQTASNSRNASFNRGMDNYGRRNRSPLNSGLWISIELIVNLSQIIAAVVVLSFSRHEHPQTPLFAWVIGYTVGCVATLPHLYWRYINRNRLATEQDATNSFRNISQNNAPESNSYTAISVANAVEAENGQGSGGALQLRRNTIRAAQRAGLREDLRNELFARGIDTLEAACSLVLDLEESRSHSHPRHPDSRANPFRASSSQPQTRPAGPVANRPTVSQSQPRPDSKGKTPERDSSKVNSGTKCYRCQGYGHIASQCSSPYKITIIEKVEDDEAEPETDLIHHVEDEEDFFCEENTVDLQVVRCALSQPKPSDDWRRTSIFHTFTKIGDKNCKVIVDSGSCINAVSSAMVATLHLKTTPHPNPYKACLGFLNYGLHRHLYPYGKLNLNALVDHLKMALDCFFAVWFVVGNVWLFGGRTSASDAPNLYRLCIVFLTFSCIGYAMPFILCAMICCCLPCIISIMGLREEMILTRGASTESINALPTYKFKAKRIQRAEEGDIDSDGEGGIVAAGTDKERIISAEDAVCCICLTKYVDNDDLRELPCGHFFHTECVDKWLKINALCPLCKKEVGNTSSSSAANPSHDHIESRMANHVDQRQESQ
ncbi:hypothetical protein M5K25_024221 [Dendrobium thyrsiflorum]|uniref:E3 ubiquitin-protein ligase n=1 Tax=Dendrobium thyrsiflorum TaxID=117978 RepID=A0ABD0U1D4_DENTH